MKIIAILFLLTFTATLYSTEFHSLCVDGSYEEIQNAVPRKKALNEMKKITLNNGIQDVEVTATPLFFASWRNRDPRVIELLIKKGADPDAGSSDEASPLAIAVYSNELQIVKALTKHTVDSTVILAAVFNSDPVVMLHLIDEGYNINYRDKNGNTPIKLAVDNNILDVANLLIKEGVREYDMKKYLNDSVYLFEAITFHNIYLVKALIEQGLNKEIPGALQKCAMHDEVNILKQLVEYGYDVNNRNSNGKTALHFAARSNSAVSIKH